VNVLTKIGFIAIGGFVAYKVAKAVSAAIVASGMAIKVSPETKVDMQGVKIKTNIIISNPTDSSMILTSPFVQLFHRTESLSQNQVSSKEFEILPFSTTELPVKLELTWQQIKDLLTTINVSFPNSYSNFGKILWLYENYKDIINKMKLEIKYSTYANGINYQDSQILEIK